MLDVVIIAFSLMFIQNVHLLVYATGISILMIRGYEQRFHSIVGCIYTDFDSTHFECFLCLKFTMILVYVSVHGHIYFVQLSENTQDLLFSFIFSTHELSEFIHIPHVCRHVLY
jgi:hypothetical protein